jgi:hypothetical protein
LRCRRYMRQPRLVACASEARSSHEATARRSDSWPHDGGEASDHACRTNSLMAPGNTARLYHRLTAYESGRKRTRRSTTRLLTEFKHNVPATFPAQCKGYPLGLPVVDLPRRWPSEGGSATAVLAGQNTAPPATLTLERLAWLLHPAILELDTRAGPRGPSRRSPQRVADVGRLEVHGRKRKRGLEHGRAAVRLDPSVPGACRGPCRRAAA